MAGFFVSPDRFAILRLSLNISAGIVLSDCRPVKSGFQQCQREIEMSPFLAK